MVHEPRVDAERTLRGHVGLQRPDVLGAHADEVSALPEPDVLPPYLLGLFEQLEALPRHRGQRRDAVVAADDAARLARAAGADGVPLQHEHVADAALREGPRHGHALDAAADDDDVDDAAADETAQTGQFGCAGRPVHGVTPGIHDVPASGTRAIAAASTVSATRSSGSRWWTSALPQARASMVVSMVSARR